MWLLCWLAQAEPVEPVDVPTATFTITLRATVVRQADGPMPTPASTLPHPDALTPSGAPPDRASVVVGYVRISDTEPHTITVPVSTDAAGPLSVCARLAAQEADGSVLRQDVCGQVTFDQPTELLSTLWGVEGPFTVVGRLDSELDSVPFAAMSASPP